MRRRQGSAQVYDTGRRRVGVLDAGVAFAVTVAEADDAGGDLAGANLQQADGTKARRHLMRKRGAAGVDLKHAIAVVEALKVGMAADDDVRLDPGYPVAAPGSGRGP